MVTAARASSRVKSADRALASRCRRRPAGPAAAPPRRRRRGPGRCPRQRQYHERDAHQPHRQAEVLRRARGTPRPRPDRRPGGWPGEGPSRAHDSIIPVRRRRAHQGRPLRFSGQDQGWIGVVPRCAGHGADEQAGDMTENTAPGRPGLFAPAPACSPSTPAPQPHRPCHRRRGRRHRPMAGHRPGDRPGRARRAGHLRRQRPAAVRRWLAVHPRRGCHQQRGRAIHCQGPAAWIHHAHRADRHRRDPARRPPRSTCSPPAP